LPSPSLLGHPLHGIAVGDITVDAQLPATIEQGLHADTPVFFQGLEARPDRPTGELLQHGLPWEQEFGGESVRLCFDCVTTRFSISVKYEVAYLMSQIPSLTIVIAFKRVQNDDRPNS